MKRKIVHTTAALLLILASLASYLFLHQRYQEQTRAELDGAVIEQLEAPPANNLLPDVLLIKKIIQTTKRLLPAS